MGGISLISSPDGGVDTAYGPTGFPGLVKEPVIVGLSIFTSLGGVLFGYDQGVISGVLVMDDFVCCLCPCSLPNPIYFPRARY